MAGRGDQGAWTGDRERVVGALCGAASVILFSSFTLVSRLGFSSSLKPWDVAALRFGIGGALLFPVLLRHGLSGVRWRDAGLLALFGGLGFALLAYGGFSLAPAAHGAVLLHGTLPLTTFVLVGVSGPGRRPQLTGLAIIAAGVGLMACESLARARSSQLLGDALLLAASASWSAYGVTMRRLGLPAARAAAIVAVFSMCAFAPGYLLLSDNALVRLSLDALLLQAAVQGVLVGAVSIFVYSRAVAALGPATAALFTAAVPCVTTLAAVPLLGEAPSRAGAIGVAVVTLGMFLAARSQVTRSGTP